MTNGFVLDGTVRHKTTREIVSNRIGIGLEKLDRNLYDPHRCYDDMIDLGAKHVRIQSGWCRTEQTKGVYDFAWLDDIVDNLVKRDMIPWMCLCYGNELYTEGAVNAAGAVGCPPMKTEEERKAWDAYVRACVAHYKGRVTLYEVWNEPDGDYCWRPKSNAAEYGAFALRTAKAVKETDENAEIAVGSFFLLQQHLPFLYTCLTKELADVTDYITYHGYQFTPEHGVEDLVRSIRTIAHAKNPRIGVIQGETGAQSRYSVNGGLCRTEWTEEKQAKFILRRLLLDFKTDVAFGSIFSMVDVFENIFTDDVDIHESKYGFFGVLGETFDKEGKPLGKYVRKPSFIAMQSITGMLTDEVKHIDDIPVYLTQFADGTETFNPHDVDSGILTVSFERSNGAKAFVLWRVTDLMSTAYAGKLTATFLGVSGKVRLVNPLTGNVYVPDEKTLTEKDGMVIIKGLPLCDYPLFVTFGDFADMNGGS